MVKKVKYALIDTELLPTDVICRNNAFEQFVGIDDYFSSNWIQLTSRMNNIKNQVMKQFGLSSSCSCKTTSCESQINGKSELFYSFNNNCGLVLVE